MIRAILRAAAIQGPTVAILPRGASARACCVYARQLLELAVGADVVARAPLAWWSLDIKSGAPGPWSPVDAAVRVGLAREAVDPGAQPPRVDSVSLVQGWRGVPLADGVSGHTFLWWQRDRAGGDQIDSVDSRGPKLAPRAWAEVRKEFPHLRVATLVLP